MFVDKNRKKGVRRCKIGTKVKKEEDEEISDIKTTAFSTRFFDFFRFFLSMPFFLPLCVVVVVVVVVSMPSTSLMLIGSK